MESKRCRPWWLLIGIVGGLLSTVLRSSIMHGRPGDEWREFTVTMTHTGGGLVVGFVLDIWWSRRHPNNYLLADAMSEEKKVSSADSSLVG